MYEPPIDIHCSNYVAKQIESDRDDAVMLEITEQYGVHVDKDELAKALAYDRGQYDKGYKEGYDKGFEDGIDYFVDYMRSSFGLYLVRSDEEVAELRKTHPDLFCLARKKEDE